MKKMTLGKTGLEVTELCFGALPIGPLQKNLDGDAAAGVIARALELGVNFVDTAQMYRTYGAIRKAMEMTGKRPVISNKSHAATYDEMDAAVKEAFRELGVDYIDIFLLHAARVSPNVMSEREGAFRCLLDYREKGLIRAAGISSHAVDVINMAAGQKDFDIVFPILNKTGMGVIRGSLAEMEAAIENCLDKGKGVYLMKALGGGNLVKDYLGAMEYARGFSAGRTPVALGMVSRPEVEMNVKYFSGKDVSAELAGLKDPRKQMFVFGQLCKSCGKCVDACHSSAMEMTDGKAAVIEGKCLKCGYCVAACPEFAIRMV